MTETDTPMKFENIFAHMLSGSTIWRDQEALLEQYTPDPIHHRDDEMHSLAQKLLPALKGNTPLNTFLYGKSGTGKTMLTVQALNSLREAGKKTQAGYEIHTLVINCTLSNTTYRVLAKICQHFNRRIPFTGWPTDKVYETVTKEIDSSKKIVIICLDEIDRLRETDILYVLSRINSSLNQSKVSILGISNNLKFTEKLDPRTTSSLSEESILFPPYNAEQLADILSQRAKIAFNNGACPEEIIMLCSALSARNHGDARKSLDLLKNAGGLAQRRGHKEITEEDTRDATMKTENEEIYDHIIRLPYHQRLILSIFTIDGTLDTGELYKKYLHLCRDKHTDPLTLRRTSSLVSELAMLGILETTVVSRGRFGRTTTINLTLDQIALKSTLEVLKC